MFRVLTIFAAVVALAVSASPVSAGSGWPDGLSQNGDLRTGSTAKGHAAGLAPDFGIYLSLRKAPPKPRGISGDVYHYELIGANHYRLLLDAVGRELGK